MNYILENGTLYHHGVKGQKWGLRQWQNPDGSLTPEGRIHYGYGNGDNYKKKQNFKNAKSKYEYSKIKVSYNPSRESYNEMKKSENEYRLARKDYRSDKVIKKAEQKAWKQQRKDYIKTKSTGERLATGLLLGPAGLYQYNSMMASGNENSKVVTFGKAWATSYLTGIVGNMAYSSIVANKQKEKY